jgi:hypothetical protein
MGGEGMTAQPAHLVPFAKGHDPRRNPGHLSKAEREWRNALESEHIPRASELLRKMIEAGLEGDVKAAEVAFKVMGLIRKPKDDAEIAELAKKLLDGMIAEAKARREGSGG